MPSPPLDSTNGQTTPGVACHHRLWAAKTVERRRAWHAIIAFGLADTIGRRRLWHATIALGRQTWSNDVRRDMPSPPLDSTYGQTRSGVAFHHRLWAAQTVERCRAWHAIIAFGQHIRSIDVGCGMPSSPLGSTHGCTTSGVACHHRLWAAHTVERHRAWHDITSHGLHTRLDDVKRRMLSPPLDSKHGQMMSGMA